MSKEIIINAEKGHTRIAILEDGDLCELYIENPENTRTIGDLHVGRIRRIMPTIQAAFVDIGQKSDAFLHFSDLSDNLDEWLELVSAKTPTVEAYLASKAGKVRASKQVKSDDGDDDFELDDDEEATDRGSNSRRTTNTSSSDDDTHPKEYLKRDRPILVKIVKEPISNKGSRISTDISLAGRFLVLVPLADYVAVSKKISSYKERRRLRTLAKSLLPKGFGVIVRTVAQGKDARSLDTDLRLLIEKWRKIEAAMQTNQKPPKLVHQDVNMASSVIRDLFSSDYDRILIDDARTYRNIKGYIQAVAPQMADVVSQYEGEHHIFQATRIAGKVKEAFESRVNLPSGGYLFIEHTEAMHVVDVNSGRSVRGDKQEENSLRVNLEAARTIAKQIRLRDLGGIIVIDFIDQRNDKNSKKIYDEMRKEFKKDRAVSKILPMTDFGLMQITRQRIRPSVTTQIDAAALPEPLPEPPKPEPKPRNEGRSSRGRGRGGRRRARHQKPEELLQALNEWVEAYRTRTKGTGRKPVKLRLHPFTATYLRARMPSQTTRWFMKYLFRVRLEMDDTMHPMDYTFFDMQGNDITKPPAEPKAKESAPSREEASKPEATSTSRSGRSASSDRSSSRRSGRSDSGSRSSSRQSSNRSDSNSRSSDRSSSRRSSNRATSGASPADEAKNTTKSAAQGEESSSEKSSSRSSNRRRRGRRGGRNRRRNGRPDTEANQETPAPQEASSSAAESDTAVESQPRNPAPESTTPDEQTPSSSSRRRSRRRGGRRRSRSRNAEANASADAEAEAPDQAATMPSGEAEAKPAAPEPEREGQDTGAQPETPDASVTTETAAQQDDEAAAAEPPRSQPKSRSRSRRKAKDRSRAAAPSEPKAEPTAESAEAPAQDQVAAEPADSSLPDPPEPEPTADVPASEASADQVEATEAEAPEPKAKGTAEKQVEQEETPSEVEAQPETPAEEPQDEASSADEEADAALIPQPEVTAAAEAPEVDAEPVVAETAAQEPQGEPFDAEVEPAAEAPEAEASQDAPEVKPPPRMRTRSRSRSRGRRDS
ncbi:MAG: Rne/Rng family ribonuclease [Bacteroidota bacterium]